MTQQLGVSRQTLWRLRRLRILREGHHWTCKTPFTSRVTGGLALAIGLRFLSYAAQQPTTGLAIHQQEADQLGGDDLSREAEGMIKGEGDKGDRKSK
jgi:hypothetical protein